MPRYRVDIRVEFLPPPGAERQVRDAVLATLAMENQPVDSEVTLLFTDEAMIRSLNRQFMGDDKVTDVLSFPAGDPTPGSEKYLGDIAISVPTALIQAEHAQVPVNAELQLLAVHATLHLLGYDHYKPAERQRMWGVQSQIMADLGVGFAAPS
ncbi:MAG TPA: rRNA maturation RNase YbeY [Patescibacteria group bacterium]|nr:rRNA maturation RNase YbeY [Patescibacteria group bacterium]